MNKNENGLAVIKNETEKGTQMNIQTTITDEVKLFNIDDLECDVKLNDIEGQEIDIVDVYLKRIESKLKPEEVEINEVTGEVINDKKVSVVTILIDKEGKSYVTASKFFASRLIKLIGVFGIEKIKKGIKIKIVKKQLENGNKALTFELVK